MRVRGSRSSLHVQAIAGTKVVLLGMDVDAEARSGLLGFAIRRTDKADGKEIWLENLRVFRTGPAPGLTSTGLEAVAAFQDEATAREAAARLALHAEAVLWSSDEAPRNGAVENTLESATAATFRTLENPIQAFRWGDYTAKPGHDYTYRVVAMYGAPDALTQGPAVDLEVRTESPDEGTHGVYFNRGVIASQRYAQLFGAKAPKDVPDGAAFTWLSSGLVEALLSFLELATDGEFGLRAAVYEFDYAPVLEAFEKARQRGVDVKIVYDFKAGAGKPGPKNLEAIQAAGIEDLTVRRTANPSYIAHNKFVVLTRGGEPVAVWTGSTNVTEGGIFGQSNVGHVVRSPAVAAKYLAYWEQLSGDPQGRALRTWNEANTPLEADPGLYPVFSPRSSLAALELYSKLLGEAQQSAFFTAAFGVNELLLQDLDDRPSVLRYVLLEKDGGQVSVIERSSNNEAAAGAAIDVTLGRWIAELDPVHKQVLNKHVFYIHDKFMILDAFGAEPTLITGSANFSDASTKNNDENMLVIRGDTRVVDVYLGEFMRIFTHYRFRAMIASMGSAAAGELSKLSFLDPTDAWSADAYRQGSHEESERLMFAGTAG
jgi:phosphatidylserine/phosphatidylglycerophosphate/cardiolipin synthase-like enzyme